MQAFVLNAANQPLARQDLPVPEPGPGQIRIRVRATGVCGTDVHVWKGELPFPMPLLLGHEPAGVVDLAGPGVEAIKSGERVGVSWFQGGCNQCLYCRKKQYKFCATPKSWITNGGGYAEYMIAEAGGCAVLPEELDWDSAAPMFCGGFSAMSAYRSARAQGGDRIAIVGIGGLGHLALQIAKAFGHEVVAITNSIDKTSDARRLGADEVLVVEDHAGKELQAIGGADVVLSFSPWMKQNSELMDGLRAGGRFVTTAASPEPMRADPVQMLFRQTSIIGSAHNSPADLVDVLQLAAAGKVKPQLETYRLDEINRVLPRLAEGKVRHRAVVVQPA